MKTTEMKVLRVILIGILGVIAFILTISEPSNDESWFFTFFLSKGIAIIIGYVAYRLFVIWDAKGLLPDCHLEECE